MWWNCFLFAFVSLIFALRSIGTSDLLFVGWMSKWISNYESVAGIYSQITVSMSKHMNLPMTAGEHLCTKMLLNRFIFKDVWFFSLEPWIVTTNRTGANAMPLCFSGTVIYVLPFRVCAYRILTTMVRRTLGCVCLKFTQTHGQV